MNSRRTAGLLLLQLAACAGRSRTPTAASSLVATSVTSPSASPSPAPSVGRVHVHVVAAPMGARLPARIVVFGLDGTADPNLGPDQQLRGARNVAVAADGDVTLDLAPGRYELNVSHGPEWSLLTEAVTVAEGQRQRVQATLTHIVPMSDWTACDLHVHSIVSGDSFVSVEDRVVSLIAEGIEFAAATEHNHIGDYNVALGAVSRRSSPAFPSLLWAPGVEVTTGGPLGPVGHFNAFPLPANGEPNGGPPPWDASPHDIFQAVRARNPDAVIQVNHPRMQTDIGYFALMGLDAQTNHARSPLYDSGYDLIEVYNGYFHDSFDDVTRILDDWIALLGTGARYVGTASSDAHVIARYTAGYPRTYANTPDASATVANVIAALRGGHAFGTNGPMVFVGNGHARAGDTVEVTGDHWAVPVRVLAAPWIDVREIRVLGRAGTLAVANVEPAVGVVRFDRAITVPVRERSGFVVVTVRGQAPLDRVLPGFHVRPFAFSNPLWYRRAEPQYLSQSAVDEHAEPH